MAITRYDCITCKVRNCSILNSCDTHTLTAISTYKLSKSLQKGERLFSEGDPVLGVCFIKKGFLKVELNGKQGRPLILQIAGRGAVFGHRANAGHRCHTSSAIAVSDVLYCYIPYDLFDEIADKSPVLKQQIINQFLNELQLVEKKAVNLAHKTVREKVAEALLLLAEAYQYEEKKQSFRISFCRQDIADLAGTTKEQVSKILKDFEKEKLIKCAAKKFSYLHTGMLRSISNQCSLPGDGK
ncbi:Crp/Fnr family transcriptional regulator [Agriterribacter sp.]|uniref:Crp/Fnr family transcriptional regulator n=1 Tax=Agriterribacter sp. TaxID=2821509 RepID=UPI002B8D73B3|nr:Crp/Fnr family transcriptional regulator [Agriterribacter sp.]HRO45683.1 Crp/Fnr family transcriptional regulator [Agriterribacter sp.]HRQ15839.1 Crp/Fnr family transcriptional regulator [Agriterribacter sp.]